MDPLFKSALAIGATGMLRGALESLAQQAKHTAIVSRNAQATLRDHPPPRSTALDLDYAAPAFLETLTTQVDLAEVDVALFWVHEPGLSSLFALLDRLALQPVRIVHVVGSAAGDPERQLHRVSKRVSFGSDCGYCPVVLGDMPTSTGRRWLTHREICTGTIQAILTGRPQMVGESNPPRNY